MEDLNNDLSRIFKFKFIKWLVSGFVLCFLLVYIATSPIIIKPLYKSESIIYAPLTLLSQHNEQLGIGFGTSAEIDAFIQILQSIRVMDSLNIRFGLYDRFGLDQNSADERSQYYQKMRSRMKIEKTRYGSISVAVKDHDSNIAADLANGIVDLGDIIKENILSENRLISFSIAKESYEKKQKEIDISEQLIEHLTKEWSKVPFKLQSGLNNFRLLYETDIKAFADLKSRYNLMRISLESKLPKSYKISPAVPSHKPVWPPRLLFALAAAVIYSVLLVFVQIVKLDA